MIVFDLCCGEGHLFEGWFGSSDQFASQKSQRLVACPQCGNCDVDKAPMAPAVAAKGNARGSDPAPSRSVASQAMPPEVQRALRKLARAQARALENSTWVGESFAEKSRAMHYGESEVAPIHGQASRDEAKALVEEGIAVAPLPFPIAPPDELN